MPFRGLFFASLSQAPECNLAPDGFIDNGRIARAARACLRPGG